MDIYKINLYVPCYHPDLKVLIALRPFEKNFSWRRINGRII
jgi:hypothetical protein